MNSEAYEDYLNQKKCKEAYSLCKKCGNRVFQHRDMEFCKKRDDINRINLRGNYHIRFHEVEDVCEFYEPISFIERIRRKINE